MKTCIWLAVIFILGFAARCATADWGGLSGDEANGVAIAVNGSWADLFRHLHEDGNPPLIYAVIRLYATIFGESDLALRLFAIVASMLVIPCGFVVARSLFGPTSAFQVALLLALCPPVVRFGTMIRMYCLLPALSLASIFCLLRLLSSPRSWLWRALYVASSALLLYCHHWGFIVIFAQVVVLAVASLRRWWGWQACLTAIFAMAVSGLLYLPWVPYLAYALTHDESPWAYAPAFTHLTIETAPEMLVGRLNWRATVGQLGMIYASLCALITLLFCVAGAKTVSDGTQTQSERQRSANFLRWLVVAGLLSALVLSSFKPAWRDRYLLAFTPVMLTLFCLTAEPLRRRLTRVPAAVIPLMLWFPAWAGQFLWLMNVHESSAWAIAEKIKQEADRGKDLVVVSWESCAPAISRVLPDDVAMISFPDLDRVRIIKWEGMNERLRDDRRLFQLLARMKQALADGATIWLVDWSHGTAPAPEPGKANFSFLHFNTVDQIRMDQIRTWLFFNARQQETFLWAPGRDISLFLSIYKPVEKGQAPVQAGQPGQAPGLSVVDQPGLPSGESLRRGP